MGTACSTSRATTLATRALAGASQESAADAVAEASCSMRAA